jgi:hypothetical protein
MIALRSCGKGRRLLLIGLLLLLGAGSAYAIQHSVTVDLRWKVLPYQTLRLLGADAELTSTAYRIREPSALDVARGFIEDENAVRLHLVSNTPWKIQVWIEGEERFGGLVLIRRHGGSYVPIGREAQVLASGSHGTFDIGIDFRVPLDQDLSDIRESSLDVVYTILSD